MPAYATLFTDDRQRRSSRENDYDVLSQMAVALQGRLPRVDGISFGADSTRTRLRQRRSGLTAVQWDNFGPEVVLFESCSAFVHCSSARIRQDDQWVPDDAGVLPNRNAMT